MLIDDDDDDDGKVLLRCVCLAARKALGRVERGGAYCVATRTAC